MSPGPVSFVPSTRFQFRDASGLWFAFRRREMLVVDGSTLPKGPSLGSIGLSPVRVQFLGHLNGEACYAAELPPEVEPPPGSQFRELRQLFGRLEEGLMGVAGRAVQIMEWDRTHQFCGACGAPTEPHPTMRTRVCSSPACKLEHYPRVAPAMIVAVERGPEILLARSPHFPPEIYSVLAGFVDPGESVEDAVHREVAEETGVRVKNLRYFASQPWPFPHSLMLGFQAEYESGEVTPDREEIEAAGFFHVDHLPKTLPGRVSISQWLMDNFCARHGRVRSA